MAKHAPVRQGHQALFLSVVLIVISFCRGAGLAQAQISFVDSNFYAETVTTLPPYKAVGLTFAPDGRLFIWQKDGVVRIFKNGVLLPMPFIDISRKVNQYQDRGLLGLTLHPNFATNGYVYLLYTLETGTNTSDSGPKTAQLTRVQADPSNPDVALTGSEVVLIGGIPAEAVTHTIGTVRFAPDGKMFVSSGDGADYRSTTPLALRAQDLNSYNGKILRLNPDGSAPGDNPFYDGTNSIRSKVWAYGLRNPYRFALHPTTGQPYIGDVGWDTWEEINRGRGANFGWPCYEGRDPQPAYQATFVECQQLNSQDVTPPLYTYNHTAGTSVIGGSFYTGTQYPLAYRGNLFFADYEGQWIRRLVFDANSNVTSVNLFATKVPGPVHLEQGPDGFLYYVALNSGEVGRIGFTGTANTPPVAKAAANPTWGYTPLTVNFSSAGSVDPDGGTLSYFWDFGDGTTSTVANPSHTYSTGGVRTFTITLTVTDQNNTSDTATVEVTVGSRPPVATISTPTNGTAVQIGDTITYMGSATDAEDGSLPASALGWTVLLHHNDHVHPLSTSTGTQGNFTVVDHGVGTYAYEIILTATDSSGLTDKKSVTLPVQSSNPTFTHIDFTYANRDALLLAGWDFLARTTTGATRDTEQTSGALVASYNSTFLRIPLGPGELWQAFNNSQNTLFRDLPTDWTSLRLKVAAFAPTANYQQLSLILYQNDDNYTQLNREYNGGSQVLEFRQERAGVMTRGARVATTVTSNFVLRLDRTPSTNALTAYVSADGGSSWSGVPGSFTANGTGLRVGIHTGGNVSGTLTADLAWLEILQASP